MSAYERQNFVTPQRLIAALKSAQIEIPKGWGLSGWSQRATIAGMSAYERQNFVTPQRLIAALQSARIEVPKGWGMETHGQKREDPPAKGDR